MHQGRTTLSKFLIQQLKGSPEQNDLAALLVDIAACIKAISAMTSKGMLGDVLGSLDTTNVQGETQKKLDVLSNVAFINTFSMGGLVAGLASEEVDDPQEIDPRDGSGRFLAIFDPLDGSSNIDVNVSVGSIFSILRAPEGRTPTLDDYLRPGSEQLAAGYAIYGPATMMVITVGKGTHGFTLDREVGNFILTHPHIEIPADTSEFAINASNERFWEPPIQRYVTECKAGKNDVRRRRLVGLSHRHHLPHQGPALSLRGRRLRLGPHRHRHHRSLQAQQGPHECLGPPQRRDRHRPLGFLCPQRGNPLQAHSFRALQPDVCLHPASHGWQREHRSPLIGRRA